MKRKCFLALFLLQWTCSFAVNYYLSNSGNDGNSGTSSAEPWQTIEQLYTVVLQPGDSIFFEAGGVFRGEIILQSGGTESAPIYLGKYGMGDLPIVSGAVNVGVWTNYSGNIYRATLAQVPVHVFADGKQMTIARFPNTGFLFFTSGIGDTGFVDTTLNQPIGFWDGATVRMRTTDKRWEVNQVGTFAGDSVLFVSNSTNEIQSDHGYYFDNLFALLDTAGEWYYDDTGQDIYLNAPSNADPNLLAIEASVFDDGIAILNSSGYIVIQNLRFQKQKKDGVYIAGISNNIVVNNCQFSLQGEIGLRIPLGSSNCEITDNSFSDINGMGIHMSNCHFATIIGNVFANIGVIPGYGSTLTENMCAIECFDCDSSTILENTIDSAGMSGIFAAMNNSEISRNVINHCMLNTNLLGAIHIYSDDFNPEHSCNIINNIVLNTMGNNITTPVYDVNVSGIDLDYQASQNNLIGNSVAYATVGILLSRNNTQNLLQKNLVYGCNESQLKISEGALQGTTSDNRVFSNIFYSINENSDVTKFTSKFDTFQPAVLDSNYYFNPYNFFAIHRFKSESNIPLPDFYSTLKQWQQISHQDSLSKETFIFRNRYTPTFVNDSNLISNGEFTNNTDDWQNFTPYSSEMLLDNSTPLDFGCLKIQLTNFMDSAYGDVISANYYPDSGKFYQLNLSCYGKNSGTVIFQEKERNEPFTTSSLDRVFPFDQERHDYIVTFQDTGSVFPYNLHLELQNIDSSVWLDNISIKKAEVIYKNPHLLSRLFVNDSPQDKFFDLGDSVFFNLDQQPVAGSLHVMPFSSAILIYDSSLILGYEPIPYSSMITGPKLFPSFTSPGTDVFIENVSEEKFQLTILAIDGIQVRKDIVENNSTEIKFRLPQSLSSGIYIVVLKSPFHSWSWKVGVFKN